MKTEAVFEIKAFSLSSWVTCHNIKLLYSFPTNLKLFSKLCYFFLGNVIFHYPYDGSRVTKVFDFFILQSSLTTSRVPNMDLDKLNLVWWFGFMLEPQLPQTMTFASKVVKSDSKMIILLCHPKSMTHFVDIFNQ